MTALRWLWAMADSAYCEAHWDYVNQWDRLMMLFKPPVEAQERRDERTSD